jgi:hypothetical protein
MIRTGENHYDRPGILGVLLVERPLLPRMACSIRRRSLTARRHVVGPRNGVRVAYVRASRAPTIAESVVRLRQSAQVSLQASPNILSERRTTALLFTLYRSSKRIFG